MEIKEQLVDKIVKRLEVYGAHRRSGEATRVHATDIVETIIEPFIERAQHNACEDCDQQLKVEYQKQRKQFYQEPKSQSGHLLIR